MLARILNFDSTHSLEICSSLVLEPLQFLCIILFLFYSDHENSKVNMSKSAVGTRRKAAGARAAQSISQTWKRPLRAAKTSGCVTVKSSQEEETYRVCSAWFICLDECYNFLVREYIVNAIRK